jgi:EpsI family protein
VQSVEERTMSGTTRKRVVAAAVTAVALVLASGAGYRVLAHYLVLRPDGEPATAVDLSRLPLEIGDWTGRDIPLTEAVIQATQTDAHVNRLYQRVGESVALFVAYGIRARDLMPHRPEVCYPGAGWTMRESRNVELPLDEDSNLECRIYRFSRGGLDTQTVTVLNYYIVDGRYCPDVSLLRSKAWRGSGGVRYMAQVQIASYEGGLLGSASVVSSVRSFATGSAGPIRSLMPDGGSHADPSQ